MVGLNASAPLGDTCRKEDSRPGREKPAGVNGEIRCSSKARIIQMTNAKRSTSVVSVIFLMSIGRTAWGQTAQIVGAISDATGAHVPDAKVTATEVNTGTARTVTSTLEGYYTIPLLPPGNYSVKVSKEGFNEVSHSGVTLAVGDNATIDVRLTVGAVSQAVSVTAVAPLVDTQSGTIKRVVDQQRVVDLPLSGRDITQLLTVQAGVFETVSSAGV